MKPYVFSAEQEQWLQALESGKYTQCRETLCLVTGGVPAYCCLGVACELFKDKAGIEFDSKINNGEVFWRLPGNEDASILPEEVVRLLNLIDAEGSFRDAVQGDTTMVRRLTNANDSHKWSFKQIAEYIRANPRNVFDDQRE